MDTLSIKWFDGFSHGQKRYGFPFPRSGCDNHLERAIYFGWIVQSMANRTVIHSDQAIWGKRNRNTESTKSYEFIWVHRREWFLLGIHKSINTWAMIRCPCDDVKSPSLVLPIWWEQLSNNGELIDPGSLCVCSIGPFRAFIIQCVQGQTLSGFSFFISNLKIHETKRSLRWKSVLEME